MLGFRWAVVVAFALAAPLLGAGSAQAGTLQTGCSGGTGDVASLIAAINLANGDAAPDTVQLQPGCTYSIATVDNNWYGPNGLPAIGSDVTIEGNGATISRSVPTPFRFFFVGADPAASSTSGYVSPGPGRLTLRTLTLTGGLAQGGGSSQGGGGAGLGGAIFSQGTVLIERSTVTASSAIGGAADKGIPASSGGGIGTDAGASSGGGFGTGTFAGGGTGASGSGTPSVVVGGGGAGLRTGQNGSGANGGGADGVGWRRPVLRVRGRSRKHGRRRGRRRRAASPPAWRSDQPRVRR